MNEIEKNIRGIDFIFDFNENFNNLLKNKYPNKIDNGKGIDNFPKDINNLIRGLDSLIKFINEVVGENIYYKLKKVKVNFAYSSEEKPYIGFYIPKFTNVHEGKLNIYTSLTSMPYSLVAVGESIIYFLLSNVNQKKIFNQIFIDNPNRKKINTTYEEFRLIIAELIIGYIYFNDNFGLEKNKRISTDLYLYRTLFSVFKNHGKDLNNLTKYMTDNYELFMDKISKRLVNRKSINLINFKSS